MHPPEQPTLVFRHAYLREKRIEETQEVSGERTVYFERARLRPRANAVALPLPQAPVAPVPAPNVWERFVAWRRKSSNRQTFEAWLILTPILIYYFIFNIVPIVLNIFTSFTRWRGVFQPPEWVGLANYARYLEAPYPLIMFNTALFAIVTLLLQIVFGFLVAVALNQKIFGRSAYRAAWYIPTLTSAAIMSQIVFIFISPFDGVLNAMLKSLHSGTTGTIYDLFVNSNVTANVFLAVGQAELIGTLSKAGVEPLIWPQMGGAMRILIVLFTLWRGVGTTIVLFLAGLTGIHAELYDAAAVDGANAWQRMRRITVPLLRPMIVFVFITGMIQNFQIFEAALLITRGGPSNMTNVMLLQIYNDAFANFELGIASAGTVVLAIALLWFSISGLRLMSEETQTA